MSTCTVDPRKAEAVSWTSPNGALFPSELEHERPKWLSTVLEMPPRSGMVQVDGVGIHVLHWKAVELESIQRRKKRPQAIVFTHGSNAHAHWFSHICPFFAQDGLDAFAISLSGNGDSGWRSRYGKGVWANDVLQVCLKLGLFDGNRAGKPILVGHSMGSFVVEEVAEICGKKLPLGGIVVLDGNIPHQVHWIRQDLADNNDEQPSKDARDPFKDDQPKPRKYAMSVLPRTRLRLTPPQRHPLPSLEEHIANHSVRKLDQKHWTWKFDPLMFRKFDFAEMSFTPERVLALETRVAVVYGERSKIVERADEQYMKANLGQHISLIKLPDAGHHCMLDYPLQLVSCVRTITAEWNRSSAITPRGALLPRLSDRANEANLDLDAQAMILNSRRWTRRMFVSKAKENPKPNDVKSPKSGQPHASKL